ncbi:P-loop containing nucleoside triphosphate hydrolase protein [Crassisporium funariophilum]|nr:P-loop containing nucleoside triphosphate hydrolase protein [Crassisporium funariophilum]
MQTRSTVLGKRDHQDAASPAPGSKVCEQLHTPDNTPNPKRARTTTIVDDGSNKENIPPFRESLINPDIPSRATRALRRTSTEAVITPPRSRPGPRRRASASSLVPATPVSEIARLTISTPPPTPPTSLLPIHARARAMLRSTCNNTNSHIAGRDAERASIHEFLASFIDDTTMSDDQTQTSMFISGSPGTGKTALVNAIIREVSTESNDDIEVISINCMALKSVDALWERLTEELHVAPKRKLAANKKIKGLDVVRALLATTNTKRILILDELDHITPNAQSLAAIFSLPESITSVLRLIGIANTHTLTTTSSSTAFSPTMNVRTIHFAPYTPVQLQEILQSRLETLHDNDSSVEAALEIKKFLPPPTLMLLTKKIAALTGDVRSLFEVLRGAIDLAVATPSIQKVDENPLNLPSPTVTPQHILAALKAYTPASTSKPNNVPSSASVSNATTSNSETVSKIRNLGLQTQLVLLSILLASKRLEAGLSLSASTLASPKKQSASPMKRSTSLPTTVNSSPGVGINTSLLHTYYSAVLSRTDRGIFEPVSRSEFGDSMGILEGVGLVSLSSSLLSLTLGSSKGKRAFGRSASFGAGLGKNGAGAVGEVKLVEGVWAEEVLRGLGASGAGVAPVADDTPVDVRKEEIHSIWEREKVRLARDVKATIAAAAAGSRPDTFSGAFED